MLLPVWIARGYKLGERVSRQRLRRQHRGNAHRAITARWPICSNARPTRCTPIPSGRLPRTVAHGHDEDTRLPSA